MLTSEIRDHACWLSQEYSPWCLLHMLLKNHTNLFSPSLLEELLPPLSPPGTSSSVTSPSQLLHLNSHLHRQSPYHEQPHHTESPPSPAQRPKAILSRYLVQRLHFGYYGSKDTISESAVRYLTARARLQFGYFAIRGRAFWNISSEDLGLECSSFSQTSEPCEQEQWNGKTGVKSGGTQDQIRRQRRELQGQGQGQSSENDPAANKDEDSDISEFSEATTFIGRIHIKHKADAKTEELDMEEKRKRIAKGNRKCEEREEKLLLSEAAQYIQRKQPDLITLFVKPLDPAKVNTTSSAVASTTSERQAAAIYWTRVALTKLVDEYATLDESDTVIAPSSPFLNRRTDALWMENLEHPPVTILKQKDSAGHTQTHGGMHLVQDDSRLFQTASGIFNDLATHPKKHKKPLLPIIDGPFSYSFEILKDLIVEYGYMPLPEDDADRKINFSGGIRASTGETEIFPSDGSHVAKAGQKGEGTSIWYYYELQRIEVMVGYLIYKAPEVLDLLFQQGFELVAQPRPGLAGLSRALLLQCCIPGCHAMVRHVHLHHSAKSLVFTAPDVVSRTIKRELMGSGNKPKRIEFQQQDFADVLKGLARIVVKDSMSILLELGMDHSVVQNRLMELLQMPGSLAPVDIDDLTLTELFNNCIPKTVPFGSKLLTTATDAVNLAIQLSFEIQMEDSETMDMEWKYTFEETLLNLRRENLIVHNHVSDWILETLNPLQSGFQICFDHAILEALQGVTQWNMSQISRLISWIRVQEKESRMNSDRAEHQWEDIKRQLMIVENEGHNGQDTVMQSQEGNNGLIGLDIEWTTNGQITLTTSTTIEGIPNSGGIRISNDGCLLLDNGGLESDLILCDSQNGDRNIQYANTRVHRYLRKGAVVEERHWIWLAMGLATISVQGRHPVEMWDRIKPSDGGYSLPVKMACSSEAYQLVWLLTLAYVRQAVAIDAHSSSPRSLPAAPSPYKSKIRGLQRILTDQLGDEAGLLVNILSELEEDVEKLQQVQ
ncbi:hypothetical protein BGZ46_006466 [Entomortierella lignicola]|nr:hypothetical protein BGZ46_006466 [Entomortierella lignicola]